MGSNMTLEGEFRAAQSRDGVAPWPRAAAHTVTRFHGLVTASQSFAA